MIRSLSRDELYFRHQLSHQQIDDLLGETKAVDFPGSKAQYLPRLNAFREVTSLFESNSISFIPQKGPALSCRLYGDPLYRAYSDLDFLLREDDVARAAELLTLNGFFSPYYRLPRDECRRRMLFRHTNELFMQSPAMETGIELHWNLFNARVMSAGEHDRLIEENRSTVTVDGREYSVLKEELELLFLVIHGGLHGWSKLKWLVDIAVFIGRLRIDEGRFVDLTGRLGAGRMVALCNRMLSCWIPGSRLLPADEHVPPAMERYAMRQAMNPDQKKTVIGHFSQFRFACRAFPGAKYRLDLLARNLYATDLAASRTIPCFAPAYYLVGPFRKLVRGVR